MRRFSGVLVFPALLGLLLACGGGSGGGGGGGGNGGGGGEQPTLETEVHFPQSVASGDPRPDSVVLWARVVDPGTGGDLTVTLELARDEKFKKVVSTRDLTARAEHDGCVKVRIDDLDSGRRYWFRFRYENADGFALSRVGRTRTAPAADDEETIRWAFLSCQDYVGRYYNALAHLLERYDGSGEDLHFIVHLGDYIYETSGAGGGRDMVFTDTDGAIPLGSAFAARSLANYRTLYKTYRSDPMLQRLHERYPMIAVWDDHEFSNDGHGATATYFGGLRDEEDPERRRNAERTFFEFMPTEVGLDGAGVLATPDGILYPDTEIYRRLSFGSLCDVLLTDTRTHRPDHLIPEDAFPATLVLDETEAEAALGPGGGTEPYLDVDDPTWASLRLALLPIVETAYAAEGLDTTEAADRAGRVVTGNLAARAVNALFAAASMPEPLDATTIATLPRGVAYLTMGRSALFGSLGSRYGVSHDLLAAYAATMPPGSDDPLGAEQSAWLVSELAASTARWKVVGSSVSAAPILLDLADPLVQAALPDDFPEELKTRIQLNADQWDGFPVAKRAWLDRFSTVPGVVLMSGDIHSSWVVDHGDRRDHDPTAFHRVYEFTGASVSSGTVQALVDQQLDALPLPDDIDVDLLLPLLPLFLTRSAASAPVSLPSTLVDMELAANGYVVLEAARNTFRATYHHIAADLVGTSYYDDPTLLRTLFETRRWEIRDGVLSPLD